jgi:tetratricopeptide (TPR) repeat protein
MIAVALAFALAVGGDDVAAAERAYRGGRYEEAHALFAAALADRALAPAPLLYNLGTCAFRLGRHAEAALHYRRALLRDPDDPRAAQNLRLAERALGIEPGPRPLPARALARLDALDPLAGLAIAIALQTAGLAAVALLRARAARLTGALLVALGLLAVARLAWTQLVAPPLGGVVVAREAALRTEPHLEWPIVERLRAGTVVEVLEHSARWMRIAHDGRGGWVERAGVSVVD